jgi:hypothetical protein
VQSLHAPPLWPHSVSVLPVTHTLFEQQPLQLPEPHVAAWHKPPPHVSFWAAQSSHCWPPKPHAVSLFPVTHVPPAQHPVQLSGPHVDVPLH